MNNELKKQIASAIRQEELSIYEICERVNNILEKAQDAESFVFFIQKVCEVRAERNICISDEIQEKIQNNHEQYGKMWGETLRIWLCKQLEQKEFYQKIWESIYRSPVFDTEDAKVYALFSTALSYCIPYYQPKDVMSMENEEFSKYTEKMIDKIEEARSMLRFPFAQRTERASALLGLLNRCEASEERTVLMSHILDFAEAIGEMNRDENESITD